LDLAATPDLEAEGYVAGAGGISEPADQPNGERHGGVMDAFGTWYIATYMEGANQP
jgi:hypothetical protein